MRNATIMLAVVAMFALTSQAAVTLYEGFDYTDVGDELGGKGNTTEFGFATGTWLETTKYPNNEARIGDGSLSCGAYTASGLSASGNHAGGSTAWNKRSLSTANSIDMDSDSVTYISMLIKLGDNNNFTALMFGDYDAGAPIIFKVRNDLVGLKLGTDGWFGSPGSNATYFAVMKIETKLDPLATDAIRMNLYETTAPPAIEPGTWTYNRTRTAAQGATGVISMLSMEIGGGSGNAIDEIRMGDTWADVTVPEPATMALLGIGGIGVLLRRRKK